MGSRLKGNHFIRAVLIFAFLAGLAFCRRGFPSGRNLRGFTGIYDRFRFFHTAKIGFISAITGLSLILSLLAVGITSLYLLFATSTDDQLLHYGSQIDQAIEMQLGQSTEEMFGTSYEDMMEQLVALRDAATGTGVQ